jgi:hypothetical protein
MHPFMVAELPEFDLKRSLRYGLVSQVVIPSSRMTHWRPPPLCTWRRR